MMDQKQFFARLHACLDERSEPLNDPELVAFLDAHPQHLEAFANMRADLQRLASMRVAPQRVAQQTRQPTAAPTDTGAIRRGWRLLATTAAAAMLLSVGWILHSLVQSHDGPTGIGATATGTTGIGPNRHEPAQATSGILQRPRHPSRILWSSLEELPPTLRPAATYTVHDPLVHTTTFTLEAYEDRSELR